MPGTSGGWVRTAFPGVAFGGARADARAAARGARGAVGPRKAAIELGVARPGAVRTARAKGRFRADGAGSAALPVQGLRQDLQRAERYAAVGPAPQGTLAVVRGVAEGETVKASAARCDVAVSTAFRWPPVSGGGAAIRRCQGDRGSGRDLLGEPEGRARAGTQGTAAGRQGEEARPLARAGAGSHGGGPERDR